MTSPQDEAATRLYYLDRATTGGRVLLKVSKVILHNGDQPLETYAVLDDELERTILLPAATNELKLQGKHEELKLRTIRQDVSVLPGSSVSFQISSAEKPPQKYRINNAFMADELTLSHSLNCCSSEEI